ncbi:biosynthetic arginine decarboxylase [Thalassotalea sp. LPB0316]|uniref:biosynthetic arginine decarboxylase n=1 Tax=Thalassotalea sp. LPB0316 TaxID=2769490 RepID=UPI001867BD7C|nr:biosynthetic arginine decarboxylase [Thalassotalea sp. LPB0316]QOL26278.1 biosynthetic arginine decarboxylase [Thalassotalea sp. LPB0316]
MTKATTQAIDTYNVDEWGQGYFTIADNGHLIAQPTVNDKYPAIDMVELVEAMQNQGVTLPVLVRFTDILQHRVTKLVNAFKRAKEARNYTGKYTAVYPIKVNQQHSVVEHLLKDSNGKVGLEAGSKPELLAILGVTTQPIKIICNGYKDSEFLRLACIGSKMGHDVCIVIEKISELKTFLRDADFAQPLPSLGIRIKLHSAAKGKWQNTGGEKGKFGLNASQLLDAIDLLKQHNALDLLNLVHFHIGSQVANIRDIYNAINECAQHYAQFHAIGVNIKTVDVGGGLGVDYDGSQSRSACSMNYSVEEYAKNVVNGFADVCQQLGLPQPDIISESGRAMTAHHAVLITNVIECEPSLSKRSPAPITEDASKELQQLATIAEKINRRNAIELYHDAKHTFIDAHQQYSHGQLSLIDWANTEQWYFHCLGKIKQVLDPRQRAHHELLDRLNEKLADKLFCNFSLFQSMPDAWGIDQLFPIMPLSDLDKPLDQRVIIQDMTCDSDGQIKQYVDGGGIENSLPTPQFNPEKPYHMAMFMVGAYQEILGDLHNLFGDTDSVHVEATEQGFIIKEHIKGESAADVLRTVHFNKSDMLDNYQKRFKNSKVSEHEITLLLTELSESIDGYTYFEE